MSPQTELARILGELEVDVDEVRFVRLAVAKAVVEDAYNRGLRAGKAERDALARLVHGEVWYWQGDGGDDIGSLACPVIIEPDVVRSIFERVCTIRAQLSDAIAKVEAGRRSSANSADAYHAAKVDVINVERWKIARDLSVGGVR